MDDKVEIKLIVSKDALLEAQEGVVEKTKVLGASVVGFMVEMIGMAMTLGNPKWTTIDLDKSLPKVVAIEILTSLFSAQIAKFSDVAREKQDALMKEALDKFENGTEHPLDSQR